jgi:hypothetical protein
LLTAQNAALLIIDYQPVQASSVASLASATTGAALRVDGGVVKSAF